LSQKVGVVASTSSTVSSRAVATVLARSRDVVSSSTSPGRTSNSWSVEKPPPARPTAVLSTAVPPRPGDHGPHRPGDTGPRRLVDLGPRLGDQGAGRLGDQGPRLGDQGAGRLGDQGPRRLVDQGPGRLRDQGAGRLVRRAGDETLAALDSLAAETRALSQTINVNKTSTSSVSSRPPPGRAITRAPSRLSTHGCLLILAEECLKIIIVILPLSTAGISLIVLSGAGSVRQCGPNVELPLPGNPTTQKT